MNKNTYNRMLVFILLILTPIICLGGYFASGGTYEICFTPGNNCADKITNLIVQAKKQILVQAYNFTDTVIATALVKAKNKGIDVQIILDKSQIKNQHSLIPFFIRNNIYPTIDYEPAIAHNKIIIDKQTVVGGSYNLSKAAANKNAENLTIIKDREFAEEYFKYWYLRKSKSQCLVCTNSKISNMNKKYANNYGY